MLAEVVVDWVGVVVGAEPSFPATLAASSGAETSSGDEGAELGGIPDLHQREQQQVGRLHEARRRYSVASFSWVEFEPSEKESLD